MLNPGPSLARGLASAAFAALVVAQVRAHLAAAGPSPRHGVILLGALLVGWALARLATGGPTPPRRRFTALWLLLALPPLLAPSALPGLAGLAARPLGLLVEDTWLAAPVVLAALSFPAALVAARAAGGATPAYGFLGGALALIAPAPVAGALALLLLAAADRVPAPHRGWASRYAGSRARLLPLVLAATVLVPTWTALRATLDPTTFGAGCFGLGVLAGLTAGRAVSPSKTTWVLVAVGALLACARAVNSATGELVDAVAALALDERSLLPLWGALGAAGAAAGAVVGVASGVRPPRAAGLAVAAGLLAGLAWPALPAAAAVGSLAFAALFGSGGLARTAAVAGLLAAVAVSLGLPRPGADELAVGRYRSLATPGARVEDARTRGGQRVAWAGVEAMGTGAVRADAAAWEPDAGRDAWPVSVEVEGAVAESTGRLADAEALAGHLAMFLAQAPDRGLLLGDQTGRAMLAATATLPGHVLASAPLKGIVRATAGLDAPMRQAWLLPSAGLRPAHPELLLRATRASGVVVEIVRAPWRDAARPALDGDHLDAVRRALAADGVYVLCLHLGWMPEGAPAAAVGAVARRFAHLQLWLPPAGADSLLVVAGSEPFDAERLRTRAAGALARIRALGFPTTAALASYAVADRDAALEWARSGGPASLPPADRLSPALLGRPIQHLASLAPFVADPGAIWVRPGDAGEGLAERLEHHRRYLELLGKAARGDMGGVFELAGSLVESDDPVAQRSLDTLTDPHVAQARAAMNHARGPGGEQADWEEANRHATTARMISPRSPEPVAVLAEIALAQGNLVRAEALFEETLALDEGNLEALFGLARTARSRRDLVGAERHLRAACRYHPHQWEAWQNLGVLLHEAGREDEAEEVLRRASGLASASEVAPRLALVEVYLATDRPTLALVEAERAVRTAPTGYAWFLRGRAHFDLEQLEQAQEDFRQAVLADPGLVEAHGGIGQIEAMRGNWEAAAEAFRGVLRLDPDNVAARENLRRVEEAERAEAATRRGEPASPPPDP